MTLPLSYVLPLRANSPIGPGELVDYLRALGPELEVLVVDGSPPPVWARNHETLSDAVRHLTVDGRFACLNGKVAGVTTGVLAAAHEKVVVADDDVRWDLEGLRRISSMLDRADLIRAQNYFSPQPWHARWDTARSLLNRAFRGDYPGTLGLRRSTFLRTGGYNGDVLFENLELIRAMAAAGARVENCSSLLVARRPPTVGRFCSQRVRQAYDDFASPGRLAVSLSLAPAVVLAGWRLPGRRFLAGLAGAAAASALVAEAGRRRGGGTAVFPASTALLAPAWLAERAVCSWLALGSRLLVGGCPYRGSVIRTAAHSRRRFARGAVHGLLSELPPEEPVVPVAPGRRL